MHKSTQKAWRALVLVVVATQGCRGCERGPQSPLSFVPADASALVWAPRLDALLSQTNAFVESLSPPALGQVIQQARAGLKAQFGVDPLDPSSFAEAGVDAAAGVAFFVDSSTKRPVLILKIKNRKRFESGLKKAIAQADGANDLSQEKLGGTTLHTLGRRFGTEVIPVLHWVSLGQWFIASPAQGKQALGRAFALGRGKGDAAGGATPLTKDEAFIRARDRVPAGQLFIFGRADARAALGEATKTGKANTAADADNNAPKAASDDGGLPTAGAERPLFAMTSIRIDAAGFSSDTFIPADRALVGALATPAVIDLASRVGDDAFLVVLSRAMGPDAVSALGQQGAGRLGVSRVFSMLDAATGLQARTDILPLLTGPITLSLHARKLDRLPQILAKLRASRGLRGLFDAVFTAEVRDGKAMHALLQKSAAALTDRGTKVVTRTVRIGSEEARIFQPGGRRPGLAWAVLGDLYIYAVGAGRLDTTLALIGNGGSPLPTRLKQGVGGPLASQADATLTAVVRPGALLAATQGLGLGGGLGALGAMAVLSSVGELLSRIGDIAVQIRPDGDGMRLLIRERIQGRGGRKASGQKDQGVPDPAQVGVAQPPPVQTKHR